MRNVLAWILVNAIIACVMNNQGFSNNQVLFALIALNGLFFLFRKHIK